MNVQTLGFCGTLFFTTMAFLAQRAQIRSLYANPGMRGQSMSTSFFVSGIPLYLIGLLYGISTQRLTLMYNGAVLAPVYAVIAFGLWRFKGFRMFDWVVLAVGSAGVLTMLATRDMAVQQSVFGASLAGFVVLCLMPPLELLKTKSPGVMRIEPSLVATVSTSFWVLYGWSTGDPVLKVASPVVFVTVVATIVLWARYGGDVRGALRRMLGFAV